MTTLRDDLDEIIAGARDTTVPEVAFATHALRELDGSKRAWRNEDGEKVWYRLVPDENPNDEPPGVPDVPRNG